MAFPALINLTIKEASDSGQVLWVISLRWGGDPPTFLRSPLASPASQERRALRQGDSSHPRWFCLLGFPKGRGGTDALWEDVQWSVEAEQCFLLVFS